MEQSADRDSGLLLTSLLSFDIPKGDHVRVAPRLLTVAHSIRMSHHFCFLWLAALWWETGKRKMAANNYYSFPLAGAQYGYKLIFLLRML